MRGAAALDAPDSFETISAVLALYRPGPMGGNAHNDYADRKTGASRSCPIHPELAER
jgi:DNA polymerase-3 subunit alpha